MRFYFNVVTDQGMTTDSMPFEFEDAKAALQEGEAILWEMAEREVFAASRGTAVVKVSDRDQNPLFNLRLSLHVDYAPVDKTQALWGKLMRH